MQMLHARCAGLDVHKDSVFACCLVDGKTSIERFGTTVPELLRLDDHLTSMGVTIIAMESTGVYWHPIWNILEERFELMLVNAQHIKQVPGRKTDVKDCQWIAQLLQHGLLRASFVPLRPQRELRDLTRQRVQLLNDRARVVNRVHKTLEGANIKLGSVATDITGKSGRRILDALVEIGTDMKRFPTPGHLASWAGLCPGNNESAGKRKSGRTRKANHWLKGALTQAAWGASRTRRSYFAAKHRRIFTPHPPETAGRIYT